MEILENRTEWEQTFRTGWLAHFEKTGQIDWTLYNQPRNRRTPEGESIDLANSRLMLISSAGGYLATSQEPFDTADKLGAYDIRVVPSDTPLDQIAYAHTHYDHAAVNADPQVLVPLAHLNQMVDAGKIGSLADTVFFMGYQPDIAQLLDETIPAILEVADKEKADGALLVPA